MLRDAILYFTLRLTTENYFTRKFRHFDNLSELVVQFSAKPQIVYQPNSDTLNACVVLNLVCDPDLYRYLFSNPKRASEAHPSFLLGWDDGSVNM